MPRSPARGALSLGSACRRLTATDQHIRTCVSRPWLGTVLTSGGVSNDVALVQGQKGRISVVLVGNRYRDRGAFARMTSCSVRHAANDVLTVRHGPGVPFG